MTSAAKARARVSIPVMLISAAAWLGLVAGGDMTFLHGSHHAMAMPDAGKNMLLSPASPLSLAGGWLLMLVAMMGPLVIAPLQHLVARSFTGRRARAIALFLAGYTGIWILAGIGLNILGQALPGGAIAAWALPLGLLVAMFWECTPVKQRCLNRTHAHPQLAAFGRQADADAFRFGLVHGFWCTGTCWALMLVPLLTGESHLIAMLPVSLWMVAERLERPQLPRWGLQKSAKGWRIAVYWLESRILALRPRHAEGVG